MLRKKLELGLSLCGFQFFSFFRTKTRCLEENELWRVRGDEGERLNLKVLLKFRAQGGSVGSKPRALLQVAIDRFQRDKRDPSVIAFSEIKR